MSAVRSKTTAPWRRLALALVAAGSLSGIAGATACAPCAGVADCETASPQVSVSGSVIRRGDGRPVAGAEVELVPTGGVGVTGTRLVARTDAAGEFRVTGTAAASGEVVGDLVVTPPAPLTPYRVRGLRFATSTRHGDGVVLGRLLADPHLYFIGELRDRRTGAALANASVTVIRRAGPSIGGDTLTLGTDPSGRFFIDRDIADVGDVVVDLVISAAGVASGTRVTSVHLTPSYRDGPPGIGGVFEVGTRLDYFGEIFFRGTRQKIGGTSVTFQRTGGIAVSPATVTMPLDAGGRFHLVLSPATEGVVVGDLSFVLPGTRAPVTIVGARFATYDSSDARFVQLSFGEQLFYVGEVVHRGTLAPERGVVATFRRTGGIAITPSVDSSVSDASGRFLLTPQTTDSGEVVGDLTLRAPDEAPVTYTGVRLRTFATDALRLAGVWGIGEHLQYVGELWSNTSRQRAGAGIRVTFRRTGGIALVSDTVSSVTGPDGRFSLFPKSRQRGEVIGELRIESPAPFAPTIVPGVRLTTFAADETRFAGVYGYGPSLLYVAEVLRADGDRPVVGARVEFQRTGGIATTPDRAAAVTDASGRVPLGLTPQANGDVIGTITVRPPAPWRDTTFVFENVRASTFDTGELRLLTAFRIPPPG